MLSEIQAKTLADVAEIESAAASEPPQTERMDAATRRMMAVMERELECLTGPELAVLAVVASRDCLCPQPYSPAVRSMLEGLAVTMTLEHLGRRDIETHGAPKAG